jgi:hypothetical protein
VTDKPFFRQINRGTNQNVNLEILCQHGTITPPLFELVADEFFLLRKRIIKKTGFGAMSGGRSWPLTAFSPTTLDILSNYKLIKQEPRHRLKKPF